MKAKDIILWETCGACPEQYDAYYKEKQIGYLRLRHGVFTVEYLDCGGLLLLKAHPKGDGCFYDDEKDFYLEAAKEAIAWHHRVVRSWPFRFLTWINLLRKRLRKLKPAELEKEEAHG